MDGQPQSLDRRLFMQFMALGQCRDVRPLITALTLSGLQAVLYEDVNDPRGIGLLVMSEDPAIFVEQVRPLLNDPPFDALVLKPGFTMLGRTYSIGYEPDLEETLLQRPRRTAMNADWRWAIWYPLRRSGRFMQLPPEDQRAILGEHGQIGFAFGAADFAHDIRLACHGLDARDNDFVIGVVGKELFPLSALVQTMRKTRQTSEFIERLGPFFVGRVIWQSHSINAGSSTRTP